MTVKFLKAFNGDSIHLSYIDKTGEKVNILIDGGPSTTYSFKDKKTGKILDGDLKITIDKIKPGKINLLILTHIDDDHIDGFLKWFGKDKDAGNSIEEIWFNSGRTIKKYLKNTEQEIDSIKFKEATTLTSVKQGTDFEQYIKDKGIWDETLIKAGDELSWNELSFKILSPSVEQLECLLKEWLTKSPVSLLDTSRKSDYALTLESILESDKFEEDKDPYNGSSLAFILKKDDMQYLFLGDAHPSVVIKELRKLKVKESNKLNVEFVKLSHHGSRKNTSQELLSLIETDKYVISTNGDMHGHPDKTTIARIVSANPEAEIYFNYPHLITRIILAEDVKRFPEVTFLSTDLI